jgi:hypothetical protein
MTCIIDPDASLLRWFAFFGQIPEFPAYERGIAREGFVSSVEDEGIAADFDHGVGSAELLFEDARRLEELVREEPNDIAASKICQIDLCQLLVGNDDTVAANHMVLVRAFCSTPRGRVTGFVDLVLIVWQEEIPCGFGRWIVVALMPSR